VSLSNPTYAEKFTLKITILKKTIHKVCTYIFSSNIIFKALLVKNESLVFDIRAKDERDREFLIEMQGSPHP
jgi:hypothetical protein